MSTLIRHTASYRGAPEELGPAPRWSRERKRNAMDFALWKSAKPGAGGTALGEG